MKHTVGCVSYVNAKPLIGQFERLGSESPVEVILDVPSKLPALLDSGKAEAVLASSFDALQHPDRTFADGCGILTSGPAASVRLFSMVPIEQIKTLALDQSSLTSNHLALLILEEKYGVKPESAPVPANQRTMLRGHDACVLIGDIGLTADADGLHVLDLGTEWTAMTGLPFVWALWIGRQDMSPDLVTLLQRAERWGADHIDEVIDKAARDTSWDRELCRHYLSETMEYRLTPAHLEGLALFHTKLVAKGFVPKSKFPTMVSAPAALVP
jgi:chorismate dehydratase